MQDAAGRGLGPVVINRRHLLTAMATGTVAAAIASPTVLRAAASSTFTVPNGGGALEQAFKVAYFDTFKAKTGIPVEGAPYMDTARVKAMVDNNSVDVDLLIIDAAEAEVLGQRGLLEPIDYDVIDKSTLLPAAPRQYYVLADVAATALAWNTQAMSTSTRPKSWTEFFDPSRTGQRGLQKAASQTLEIAALGGGQSRESLYPIDLDKAFKTLDAIKPQLSWWTTGAQSAQQLIDGEVDMSTAWNGRLFRPKLDGAKIDYTFDGALFSSDAVIIPKGAKNKKLAMTFLANLLDPRNQATFAKAIPYGPVTRKAFDFLDASTLAILPNSENNAKTAVFQDFAYWAEHGAAVIDRFNAWLLG